MKKFLIWWKIKLVLRDFQIFSSFFAIDLNLDNPKLLSLFSNSSFLSAVIYVNGINLEILWSFYIV